MLWLAEGHLFGGLFACFRMTEHPFSGGKIIQRANSNPPFFRLSARPPLLLKLEKADKKLWIFSSGAHRQLALDLKLRHTHLFSQIWDDVTLDFRCA